MKLKKIKCPIDGTEVVGFGEQDLMTNYEVRLKQQHPKYYETFQTGGLDLLIERLDSERNPKKKTSPKKSKTVKSKKTKSKKSKTIKSKKSKTSKKR